MFLNLMNSQIENNQEFGKQITNLKKKINKTKLNQSKKPKTNEGIKPSKSFRNQPKKTFWKLQKISGAEEGVSGLSYLGRPIVIY